MANKLCIANRTDGPNYWGDIAAQVTTLQMYMVLVILIDNHIHFNTMN